MLNLPPHVFPAAMLVLGYPTEQQARRPKPERFNMADIVCENVYRRKDGPALREMFAGRCGARGYDAWMDAFCQRKYNSDFSREMTRSVEAYLRDYGLVRAEDGGEDGRPGAPDRGPET